MHAPIKMTLETKTLDLGKRKSQIIYQYWGDEAQS